MSYQDLPRNTNQALGIAEYAIEFMKSGTPSAAVLDRTALFHGDACLCGLSALAMNTNAPKVLRQEALSYPAGGGATVLGMALRFRQRKPSWPTVRPCVNGTPTAPTSVTDQSLVIPLASLATMISTLFPSPQRK